MFENLSGGKTPTDVRQALQLIGTDFSRCNAETVRSHVSLVHTACRQLDAVLVRLADRARHLEASGFGAPAEEVLLGHGHVTAASAGRQVGRSEVADGLPHVGDAIRSGRAIAASVDTLARAWRRLDDEQRERFATAADHDLAMRIGGITPDTFGKVVRDYVRSIKGDDGQVDHDAQVEASTLRIQRCRNGMRRFILEIDPLRGDEVEADINSEATSILLRHRDTDDRRSIDDGLRAEALHALVRGGAINPSSGVPRSTGLSLLCDQRTAQYGPHDDTVCETYGGDPLPRSVLSRLACDSYVMPLLIGSDGLPFDAGRASRTATPRQKSALRAIYDSCPLSGTPFRDCEIHHVVYWEHDGHTDLDNLVPISRRWHHLIHDQNWTLVMHPDRSLDLYRPDGEHHRHVPQPIPMTRRHHRERDEHPASDPIAA